METKENRNTTVQNLWYSAKVVLRGKFIAMVSYLSKQEQAQINALTLQLKETEKEQSPKLVQEGHNKDESRKK